MRTTKRIAFGITAMVMVLSPATGALAGEGPQPADNVSPNVTIAPDAGQANGGPVAINPGMTFHPNPDDEGNQVDPELAIPVAPGVLTPDDDGQVYPSLVPGLDIELLVPDDDPEDGGQVYPSLVPGLDIELLVPDDDPEDGGAIEVAPGNPPVPEWLQEMIDQAVADALAAPPADQSTEGPTQVTVEVSAPATDTELVAAAETVAETSTRGTEPWAYGAGGLLAGMAVCALLALGARATTRQH